MGAGTNPIGSPSSKGQPSSPHPFKHMGYWYGLRIADLPAE